MISTIIRDKSVINIYAINIFIILNYYLHKVIIISYYKLCDFPGGSVVKKKKTKTNMPATTDNARDAGSSPGSALSPRVGNGNTLCYSCLGNPMDRRSLEGYSYKTVGHSLT